MNQSSKINLSFIMYGGLTYGGAHRQAIRLAGALDKEKFTVRYFWCRHNKDKGSDFLFPQLDLSLEAELKNSGVETIEFRVGHRNIAFPNHPWFETNFFEIFNKYPTDIIFTVRAGYPEFPFVHLQKPIVEWNVFGCVDNSDNLVKSISVSPWIQKKWIQNKGARSINSVCYSGLDVNIKTGDLRKDLGIKKDEIVIGFHQRKDDHIYAEHALLAFSRIKEKTRKSLRFIILGGSEKYKILAQNLGIDAIFLPIIFDYRKVSSFLNTLDIYAHSGGAGETLGIAVQEAMMHGLPIVSMYGENNGHVDVIEKAGKVCRNQEEYQNFLLELIQLDDLRDCLSRYAKERAEKEFSVDKVAKFFEKVFHEVYKEYVVKKINFKIQPMNIYYFYSFTFALRKILNRSPFLKKCAKTILKSSQLFFGSRKYFENDPFFLYKIKPKIIFLFWQFIKIFNLKDKSEIIVKNNQILFSSFPANFFHKFIQRILESFFVKSKLRFVLNDDYEIIFTKQNAVLKFKSKYNYFWKPADPYSLLGMPLRGDFEPLETELMLRLISSGDVVFDVGANFGWYSVISGHQAGLKGKVHSFEPVFSVAEYLSNNLKLNNLNNVTINTFGLSDRESEEKIYIPKIYGTAFASLRKQSYGQDLREETIKLITLDDYCSDNKIKKLIF